MIITNLTVVEPADVVFVRYHRLACEQPHDRQVRDQHRAGAEAAGAEPPVALAVTVLTSDDSAPDHIAPRRMRMAIETGCGGIVCAAADLANARAIAPRLVKVVPGIRPAGVAADDQARAATPQQAIDGGADLLVIGRAVTRSDDPEAAAEALAMSLELPA